jgi:hypothetical protein
LTHFTEAIFAARQERVAPSCGTLQATRDAADDKKRPTRRVGQLGAAGFPETFWAALARYPRIALRAAPARADRFAPMKWVNI